MPRGDLTSPSPYPITMGERRKETNQLRQRTQRKGSRRPSISTTRKRGTNQGKPQKKRPRMLHRQETRPKDSQGRRLSGCRQKHSAHAMLFGEKRAGIIRWAQRAKPGNMQTVFINGSNLASKMLLRVLLARLLHVSSIAYSHVTITTPSLSHHCEVGIQGDATAAYFCGFANLLPNRLPLVGVVLLDCGEQGCALFPVLVSVCAATTRQRVKGTHLVFSKLGVVHVLWSSWSADEQYKRGD